MGGLVNFLQNLTAGVGTASNTPAGTHAASVIKDSQQWQRDAQAQNLTMMQDAAKKQQLIIAHFTDPTTGKAYPQYQPQYDEAMNRFGVLAGQIYESQHPNPESMSFLHKMGIRALSKMHLTNDLNSRIKKWKDMEGTFKDNLAAGGQLPYGMTPEGDAEAAKHGNTMEEIKARGESKQAGFSGRPVQSLAQTIDSAISLSKELGHEYIGTDGKPIDLEAVKKADPNAKLVPLYQGKQLIGYVIGDQKDRLWTWDNERHIVGELGVNPQGEGTVSVGAARVPTVGTHQVPGMNPGETVTLHTSTTPVTSGGENNTTTPTRPSHSPTPTRPSHSPTPKTADRSGSNSGKLSPQPPPFAKGTMLSQGRQAQPVVAAMNTVAANVFGGDGEPPIWDNAWMFDNPEIKTALNKALTMNALKIPGTGDDPTVMQQLATTVGLTGASQEQVNRAIAQSRDDLERVGGPEAMKMFARMAAMQEDLSALRSATKGSAAQGSIQTIVRAAPVYNVSSSQNFRDMLGSTLNTAAAAMGGYPAINPEYINWWKNGARFARGGPEGGKTYKQTATGPGGHKIGSDDGETWYDMKTGQKVQ